MTAEGTTGMTAVRARLNTTRARRLELLVLLALLALAALTRLPGLADRGRWDADQGHDMLVLRALATDGEVPLLGPKTSIGTFHHGAVYYYLLAPAAIASAADPVAVTGEIALFGIAAVAGAWWLARLLGGPLAGALAGLLAAISPAGIDESTFIWNPNLIPAAAALAFASAIMARRTGRARWWVASGVGAMVTMQSHVLGVVVVVPLAWAWGADLVRRRRGGQATAGVMGGGVGAAAVILAGFLPLLAYELGHGFAETRAILEYLSVGGRQAAGGVLERVLLVGLRSITWPFTGLITDRVAVSLVTAVAVVVLGAVAVLGRRQGDRVALLEGPANVDLPAARVDLPAARWLAAGLGSSVVALAMFAPSLAVIVPGLPNDHYHAFLDPIVLALVGVGLARLAASAGGGRVAAGALTVVLAGVAITAWPPAQAPDGGWPLADAAAGRVMATTGTGSFFLDGIPPFKSADALRFPLERRGAEVLPGRPDGSWVPSVVVCDPLFEEVVGAACGGPAEDAWRIATPGLPKLILANRFDAGSRRVISVYMPNRRP
jgi:hypothetical protein